MDIRKKISSKSKTIMNILKNRSEIVLLVLRIGILLVEIVYISRHASNITSIIRIITLK